MDRLLAEAQDFVSRYEAEHPDREQAFRRFFCRTDKGFFQHIVNIKFMVYGLDEEIFMRMLKFMRPWRGIYIQIYSGKNPRKNGASAYFGRDFWGRARIRYYEIDKKRQLNPPYKTFFHEFGHALDDLSVRGRKFRSDRFQFTQEAEKNCLRDKGVEGVFMDKVKVTETRTIHDWALFDVENYLVQTAVQLLGNTAKRTAPPAQYRVVHFVVYGLFLCPEGEEKLKSLTENTEYCGEGLEGWEREYVREIRELYEAIQRETGQKILNNVQDTIVLPKDLFGGITNNQLGGGHGKEYWFKKKRRIREVSREAFAGYFEYRATLSDPVFQEMVINPHNVMPCTKAALEGMLREIL